MSDYQNAVEAYEKEQESVRASKNYEVVDKVTTTEEWDIGGFLVEALGLEREELVKNPTDPFYYQDRFNKSLARNTLEIVGGTVDLLLTAGELKYESIVDREKFNNPISVFTVFYFGTCRIGPGFEGRRQFCHAKSFIFSSIA